MKFLHLAYIATWTVHLIYIGYLRSRFKRLQQEVKELGND